MKALLLFSLLLINISLQAQSLIGKWGLTMHYVDVGNGLKPLKNGCILLAADTVIISADSTFKYYSYYKGKNENGYMYGKWSLKDSKLKFYAIEYEPKGEGTTMDITGEFSKANGEIILDMAHCIEIMGKSHYKRKK